MAVFDATNPRHVRIMRKAAAVSERNKRQVMAELMSTRAGREYIHDLLTACHVYATSFADSDAKTNFNEGERNVGLRILADIFNSTPDEYTVMMREANERTATNDSRLERSDEDTGGSDRTARDRDRAIGDDFNLEPDQPRRADEREPGEERYDMVDE